MASSKATTVAAYLAELPAERRAVVSAVRDVVVRNLPPGYREGMNWGMISYEVPLERFPATYNKQPLSYVALAAQKNYNALYLVGVYGNTDRERRLRAAFDAIGKKLDMGKSCIRFRTAEDLPLEAIGEIISETTPEQLIATHDAAHGKRK